MSASESNLNLMAQQNCSIPRVILEFFIIKLTIAKLNELKVHTRVFLDDQEENYFVVLKTLEQTLASKAECEKMKKEVEIGLIDIGSLLPVDH